MNLYLKLTHQRPTGVGLPTGRAWGGGGFSFHNFSSVVKSKMKQEADPDYKPTAWELLQDSIHQSKMKSKFSKADEDEKDDKEKEKDKDKKKEEVEEKTITVKERMELAELSERERALCYADRR